VAGGRIERFGCFGKLPASREFIIEGARDLADVRFDRWVGEGLGAAKARLGSRFDRLFSTFPEYEFLWTAGGWRKLVAGRVVPSTDGAGRIHPFCVFAVIDAGGSPTAHLLLHSARAVFDELNALLVSCRGAAAASEVLATVRIASPSVAAVSAAANPNASASVYSQFATTTSGGAFWGATFGDLAVARGLSAMLGLGGAAASLRGNGRELGFAIRTRLPRDGGVDPFHATCFWYDLFVQHAGTAAGRVTLFWSTTGRGEFAPTLFLLPPDPLPSHWTFLVDHAATSDSLVALDGADDFELSDRSTPPALRGVMDSPSSTLQSYLSWAGGAYSR